MTDDTACPDRAAGLGGPAGATAGPRSGPPGGSADLAGGLAGGATDSAGGPGQGTADPAGGSNRDPADPAGGPGRDATDSAGGGSDGDIARPEAGGRGDGRGRPGGDRGLAAWSALLRVHAALVPELDRELSAAGLPLSWYDVLLELNGAPGRRLRMSELGARVVLSRERVSRVVDELERAGLVRREPNPDDRRSSFAVLTPGGRERLRSAAPTYLGGIARTFSAHLVGEEAAVLAGALERVLAAAEQRPPRRRR